MKKALPYLFFFILLGNVCSQNDSLQIQPKKISKLFINQETLPLRLSYSNLEIRKKTNDSTYLKIDLFYQTENELWEKIEIELRKRGHYRLAQCYLPPIKIKIKKDKNKGTLFEGNKKLKLVLPCSTGKSHNDYLVKEYLAYKLYEIISPYHFKTRFVKIDFTEIKGNKTKQRNLNGFLMEDIKKIAKRFGGKEYKRSIHPLNLDDLQSARNSMFQFMIGNVDFSMAALHNEKLIFVDKIFIPIPYDFDLSGLVNSSYSFVPQISETNQLPISDVTERLYRGFKRNLILMQKVRGEYLQNKEKLLQIVDDLEPLFENKDSYKMSRTYILEFFDILASDRDFENDILSKMRAK